MTTAYLFHPAGLGHETPPGHPEQIARLEAVEAALASPGFADLVRLDPPEATEDQIRRAHPQTHIDAIRAAIPDHGQRALDADTHVSAGSLQAALRAAGALVAAVDAVMAGEVRNAFCAGRPPGHHAETATPMGFCLFGNAVIGARHAAAAHGLTRIAIVDFDVHHGNGTQDLIWDDPAIALASTHQSPLYPGTGQAQDTGAHGQILNVPLPPGADGPAFRRAFERQVMPFVAAQRPELVIVSAGFDAHAADPLANLSLVEADFAWVTHRLCDLADAHCAGRLISTLEGGYDLDALGASVAAHVGVLMERGK
ncbi:MAG: histone deacetylase family protein [Pseudomonadota bacterium]